MKKLPEGRGGVGQEAFGPGRAARIAGPAEDPNDSSFRPCLILWYFYPKEM
jgi:hypothetical protein